MKTKFTQKEAKCYFFKIDFMIFLGPIFSHMCVFFCLNKKTKQVT